MQRLFLKHSFLENPGHLPSLLPPGPVQGGSRWTDLMSLTLLTCCRFRLLLVGITSYTCTEMVSPWSL